MVYLPGRREPVLVDALPFVQAAALNLAPGFAYIEKVGRNPDTDALTAPEDVWNGSALYTGFPTQVEPFTLASSSAADTAAGTGARTVRLVGLGADYAQQFETVTLNGTTPVVSTLSWSRLNRAYVLTAGTGGTNAGDITIRHQTTTANVFAILPIGYGQTQIANYTVPAGYVGLVTRLRVSCSNSQQTAQEAEFNLMTREPGGVFRVRRPLLASTTTSAEDNMEGGIRCPAGTDIVVRVRSATADNLLTVARFDALLVDITDD